MFSIDLRLGSSWLRLIQAVAYDSSTDDEGGSDNGSGYHADWQFDPARSNLPLHQQFGNKCDGKKVLNRLMTYERGQLDIAKTGVQQRAELDTAAHNVARHFVV